jgi:hypothetical protein
VDEKAGAQRPCLFRFFAENGAKDGGLSPSSPNMGIAQSNFGS